MSMRMRRGSTGGTPPGPPPATYGPVEGPQWVRDNAAPQTITVPPGAIEFTSRADLVTKIAANPAGTDFKSLASTVYTWSQPLQESVKAPRLYFLPGAIVDGFNNSVSGIVAFSSEPGAAGIHIRGGEFRNFNRVFSMNGNSVFEDATAYNCFDKVFNFGGSNNRATRVYAHSGGRYNISMFSPSYGIDNVLEHCHIANGNTRGLDPTVDAGGTKFLIQDGLICRYNWVENNNGSGLWWDGNNRNLQIYDNVCEDNDRWGIFYELGFGGTVIHHNALFDNANNTQASSGFGTAQLLSSGSDATTGGGDTSIIDIYNNWIDGDGTQVQMGVMNHSGHGLAKGTHYRDNDVWDRGTVTGRMAGVVSTNGPIPLTDDNTFEDNHYHVLSGQLSAAKFRFGDSQNDATQAQTFTQWKAAGRDDTGTMVAI